VVPHLSPAVLVGLGCLTKTTQGGPPLKKKIPVVAVAEPEEAAHLAGLPLEATVALADLARAVKDGLLGFCADVGLMVMAQVMEDELTRRIGPKHARLAERSANWHGTTTGPVVLGGRLLSVERPRGRSKDGEEITLDSWAVFSSKDLLDQLTAERVLAGVATRRHADVAEPLGPDLDERAKGTGRSSVSRRWKRATEAALAELMARDLSALEVAALMVDGIDVAGQCAVAALVITADGTKVPAGLWLGGTENKTVVSSLLADIVARGLRFEDGLLVVIDGAKALSSAVAKVFGEKAVVQRCVLHKRRNVWDHLPQEVADKVDRRLALIFANPDAQKGLETARRLASELKADHPDAAASLLEGLEDMFALRRLGIGGNLAEMLTCTNAIESMISVARTTMRNVKHWQDGEMKKRWVAAGMLEAQRSFRRIRGYKQMPALVAALRRHANVPVTPPGYDQQAA
jgi:putative transposase